LNKELIDGVYIMYTGISNHIYDINISHLLFAKHRKYILLCTPLPLWILWRRPKTLHLRPRHCHQIPKRISGPILNRIDIHIEVPRMDYEKLSGDRLGESSASIRKRV